MFVCMYACLLACMYVGHKTVAGVSFQPDPAAN